MKTAIAAALLAVALFAGGAQARSADDRKWIAECMRDNAGAGAGERIVRAYCECMTDAMDDNETRSVSVFELANPKIRAACDRKAGWR